jgi:hypothetical protein
MNQVSITEFRRMLVPQIKEKLPFEVLSDGVVIATVGATVATPKPKLRMKCPNCKGTYEFAPDDGKPPYFTMRH